MAGSGKPGMRALIGKVLAAGGEITIAELAKRLGVPQAKLGDQIKALPVLVEITRKQNILRAVVWPSPQVKSGDIRRLVDWWNGMARRYGLPRVHPHKMSDMRRQKCRLRIKEGILHHLKEIEVLVAADEFWRGENDRGWRMNFDYLIRNADKWQDLAEQGRLLREQAQQAMSKSPWDSGYGYALRRIVDHILSQQPDISPSSWPVDRWREAIGAEAIAALLDLAPALTVNAPRLVAAGVRAWASRMLQAHLDGGAVGA